MASVTYDRPLFRSTRTLTILLCVFLLLMLALVTSGSYRLKRHPSEFWELYVYIVAVPLFGTVKTLAKLWELEKERKVPDKAMEFIYSMALLFPIVAGILPVLLVLRFAGAFGAS